LILTENGLGYIVGDFFTKSSGHSEGRQSAKQAKKSFLKKFVVRQKKLKVEIAAVGRVCNDLSRFTGCPAESDSLSFARSGTGLPDFSTYNIPKREKIYQMSLKYTR
jgi:hypothetical protein